MQILYLYPARAFGGASKSLNELYIILRGYGVKGTVICPRGRALEQFERAGFKTIPTLGLSQFDNTLFGHYRGFRWLILLRELFFLPFSLFALIKAKQANQDFDLIHINEVPLLPLAVLAKQIFKVPIVVHVRSVQRCSTDLRSKFFFCVLQGVADEVICIDETVKKSLPANFPCTVIHNGLALGNAESSMRSSLDEIVTLGYVGGLLRMKGIYELLDAVQILFKRGLKFKLLVYGENIREASGVGAALLKGMGFWDDVKKDIQAYVLQHGLQHVVELRGFAPDVRDIYPLLDVLCFPSHLNAAGRPVFEAAFFGIPSVVAMTDPLDDAIRHDITGVVIEKPDPVLIANALEKLIVDDVYRNKLGSNAKHWATTYFDINKNSEKLYQIYRKTLKSHSVVSI